MSRFIIIFVMVCLCSTVANASSAPLPACLLWGESSNRRDDYTYTVGIGAHKVHTRRVKGWNVARRICNEEGGHLAIVNSAAEAKTIGNLLKDVKLTYGFIGFHNLFENGDYLTLHSQTLAKAGYTQWGHEQPQGATGENCGGIDSSGKLHDVYCAENGVFVCELSID